MPVDQNAYQQKMYVNQMSADQMSVKEKFVIQMSVGQMPVCLTFVDQMSAGKMPSNQMNLI